MKTSLTAINKVFSVLKSAGGLSISVFKQTKPTDKHLKEYTVINALPINSDVMQACIVNVNYHTKDLKAGYPDNERLDLTSSSIIALLDGVVDQSNSSIDILIDYQSQETIREEALNEHYSNIRFSVKIINK